MLLEQVQIRRDTIADFRAVQALPENEDRLLELIDGEIVKKRISEKHGSIIATLGMYLNQYLRQRKLGRLSTQAEHTSFEDEFNLLLPDLSFIAGKRPMVDQGSVPHMPDLAIEVKSRNDRLKNMREKALYYLNNGTKQVWLVIPKQRLIEVYTPEDVTILTVEDTLSGGELLPGFTLPVREVFADPLLDETETQSEEK